MAERCRSSQGLRIMPAMPLLGPPCMPLTTKRVSVSGNEANASSSCFP